MALTHSNASAVPLPVLLLSGTPYPGRSLVNNIPLPTILLDVQFGGRYQITGSLKYDSTPTDLPIVRKLILFAEPQMSRVASTWSDAAGSYSFVNLSSAYKYTVIAFDYQHGYRAVVADNLTPDAMP